jgi:hypothetical protein
MLIWYSKVKSGFIKVRIVCGAKRFDHCKPLFIKTGFLMVINLYICEVSMFVKKNVFYHVKREDFHNYMTRYSCNLEISRVRLSRTQNYHISYGVKILTCILLVSETSQLMFFHLFYLAGARKSFLYNCA